MWSGKIVELEEWAQFAARLANELAQLGHTGLVAVRNFELTSFDLDESLSPIREVDRLEIVLKTGTDRDEASDMWNAPGHDFEHDKTPSGKLPADIIYAYIAKVKGDGYSVYYDGEPEEFDLTCGLSDQSAILIYDATKLERVAKNELWFRAHPRAALLLIFRIRQCNDQAMPA